MLAPGIKSRPVYGTLEPQAGLRHVCVGDAEGVGAIIDMAPRCPKGFFRNASIVSIAAAGAHHFARFEALEPETLIQCPSLTAAAPRLVHIFGTAKMGTRLYLAGTEGVIGQVMRLALEAGLELGAIATEHRGSAARRVQCVHCKGVTEDVTTQPFKCTHCRLHLFVRDHYSRRLAAFQGVCIDAEDPGNVPPIMEIFA